MSKFKQILSTTLLIFIISIDKSTLATPALQLSVNDSINMALKNNYSIQYALQAKEQSYWALKEAKKNKGPTLNLTHTSQRYNTPPAETASNTYEYTSNFDNQLELTLPIYSGNKLENQIKQAKLDLNDSELDISIAKQQLRLTVITDYLTVLKYLNEAKIAQDTVNNYDQHLQLVQQKFSLGLVAKTDVLSSQVDLADAKDDLVQAQNNYMNALASLNNELGLPHNTELILKDTFTIESLPNTLDSYLDYATKNRLELLQYENKVTSSHYDIDIAKAGHRPTVDLTAQQDWYDDNLPGGKNKNWLVALSIELNVFDSGITSTKIKQAQYASNMIKTQALQQRDSILLSVRQYYLNVQEAEKRLEANKTSIEEAAENLQIEKVRYDVGVGTNLDLRDSVLALNSAQKTYLQAIYDFNINKANLEQAIGIPVN